VPADLQPTRLSVTSVETLLRDPYAVFARHILRLDKLPPFGFAFDARLQGTIWHETLAAFVEAYPSELPPHALDELLRIGRRLIEPYMDEPQVEGFVWPRFQRAAGWFIGWECERRPEIARITVESEAALELALGDGAVFRLTARPDRVELRRDGGLAIVDFKTGSPPASRHVLAGFSPQLTLEAAILQAEGLRAGHSADTPRSIAALTYVGLSGGTQPGKAQDIGTKNTPFASLDQLAAAHLDGLRRVLEDYRQGRRGFTSKPFPALAPAFSDYDHLARVAEWADEGLDEDSPE
jgi:ATP-dependent helicase/nuclease subunit B